MILFWQKGDNLPIEKNREIFSMYKKTSNYKKGYKIVIYYSHFIPPTFKTHHPTFLIFS